MLITIIITIQQVEQVPLTIANISHVNFPVLQVTTQNVTAEGITNDLNLFFKNFYLFALRLVGTGSFFIISVLIFFSAVLRDPVFVLHGHTYYDVGFHTHWHQQRLVHKSAVGSGHQGVTVATAIFPTFGLCLFLCRWLSSTYKWKLPSPTDSAL